MASGTAISALWQGKCPRCRKGKVFTYPLRRITRFSVMNPTCSHCNASFEPEPGFYFGAMFVSYAFNVALFIVCWILLYFLFDVSDWTFVAVIAVAAIAFTPVNYRISRLLFLYWFGGLNYDKSL